MTVEDLKKMSIVELKAIAFDLSQERDQINQSISLVLNIVNEKIQLKQTEDTKAEGDIKLPELEVVK